MVFIGVVIRVALMTWSCTVPFHGLQSPVSLVKDKNRVFNPIPGTGLLKNPVKAMVKTDNLGSGLSKEPFPGKPRPITQKQSVLAPEIQSRHEARQSLSHGQASHRKDRKHLRFLCLFVLLNAARASGG
jgi:hypothetical protein